MRFFLLTLVSVIIPSLFFAQKPLKFSTEKNFTSIRIIPYADGTFSIATAAYHVKTTFTITHYDTEGNFVATKTAILDYEIAPYDDDVRVSNNVIFDNVEKRWFVLNTKKGITEMSEWNENLEMVRSVKIADTDKDFNFRNKAIRSDGKLIFLKKSMDEKQYKRYEYDPVNHSLSSVFCFKNLHSASKGEVTSEFAGIINDVEYFIFWEEKETVNGMHAYRQTLMSYSQTEAKVAEKDFSLSKGTYIYNSAQLLNVGRGNGSLYVYFGMQCLKKECADNNTIDGFRLFQISRDGELAEADIWPSDAVSWTGRPMFQCHAEGDDLYLIFSTTAIVSSVAAILFDMETKEQSDVKSIEVRRFSEKRDLEILFMDKDSDHLAQDFADNSKDVKTVAYIEDAEGKGKLFLMRYTDLLKDIKITMYK